LHNGLGVSELQAHLLPTANNHRGLSVIPLKKIDGGCSVCDENDYDGDINYIAMLLNTQEPLHWLK